MFTTMPQSTETTPLVTPASLCFNVYRTRDQNSVVTGVGFADSASQRCVSRDKSVLSADERVESAVVNMISEMVAVRLGLERGSFLSMRIGPCNTYSNPSWHLSRSQWKDVPIESVGDGIKYAPSLACADVEIALLPEVQENLASNAASIILLGNKLSQVYYFPNMNLQ